MQGGKQRWISFGKFIAIFAVMTDHLMGSLYFSEGIRRSSYFSVSLFVLLMGVTTYLSFNTSKEILGKKVIKRIQGIIIPYIIAVFFYHCVFYKGFYWLEFWNTVKHFNATGSHYYVLLYIQLLLASPVIFILVKNIEKFSGVKKCFFVFTSILVIAYLSRILNLYTNIANIYAGRLFGGSYTLCLYFGMMFGKYLQKINNQKIRKPIYVYIFGVSFLIMCILIGLVYAKGFVFDKQEVLGSTINPPGITLLICAIAVMTMAYGWDKLVEASEIAGLNFLENIFAFIGQHTLYIFLYHKIFLDYVLNPFFQTYSIWIKAPLYYFVMITGSLIIEKTVKLSKQIIVQIFSHSIS